MSEGYVDIHAHIIPGVDDGAYDIVESEAMLKLAYEQGIRVIYATPHCNSEKTKYENKKLLEEYEKLKIMAASIGEEGIEIILGNEIFYGHDIIDKLESNEYHTMGDTRFVLIEFHYSISYNELYASLRRVIDAGYKPILAHVERYACLYKRFRELDDLISLGVLLQLNSDSVIKRFNRKTLFCIKMVNNGYIHFLGSDCHSISWRIPMMQDAVRILRKKVSGSVLDRILYTNPVILKNDGFL